MGFRRSPERSSGPILIYYDGYYPLANSVVFVIPSVSSHMMVPIRVRLVFDWGEEQPVWKREISDSLPRYFSPGWGDVMRCDAL